MSSTDNNNSKKKLRNSNLELYRIISMMMIVAHHYVVNSGLTGEGGPLLTDFTSGKSLFLSVFGAWGKTGINCFLMITGYYMCLKISR
jgi:peptidoglycan/LPS O-acetylase OafA/YrhL